MTTTVRDLMSFGVLTMPPDKPLAEIVGRIRRVGHEGYPVINNDGQVIGLLTARDVNRATENGLEHLPVRHVMLAGDVHVAPRTPLSDLLTIMVNTGWGQVPVIEDNVLVGIVTRTDVIAYYAALGADAERTVSHDDVTDVLGTTAAGLIALIAKQAASSQQTVYMVGGVVRDLLLQRPNYDIDFVLEGDAITLTERLAGTFGGHVETHQAFGTAKWHFDEDTAAKINLPLSQLPAYIDIVTARHEFYEQPAVLPTVYNSGIRLDLRRRDFTINALAVQLGRDDASGTVIDLFGGLSDLNDGLIHILHSLSFADDPTRILRAVRFAHRLGFEIESRTAELLQASLPMLKRVTGERLRNELTLLLKEPDAANALLRMQSVGVLQAIEPAFVLEADLLQRTFAAEATASLPIQPDDPDAFRWLLLATTMDAEYVQKITSQLLFNKTTAQAMAAAARLTETPYDYLAGKPSHITFQLEPMPPEAILAVWVALPDYRDTIEQYLQSWQHIAIVTDGNTLKQLGLKPGPRFKELLQQIRAARIDGHVRSDDEERAFARSLVESEQ